MQKLEQRGYLAPEIEVNYLIVEQGFSGSQVEDIGGEKEEGEW